MNKRALAAQTMTVGLALEGHMWSAVRHPRQVRPNPSIERTRTGMALRALISFWALRALPARAAHVKR